ncbi:Protein of unknown function [Paenibacillus sp. UNC496MF]|uniref:DUF2512 family protein n=1 Tax=Paenibacillus sp. UNC496MF TaxID=1502753 RepID=UPI0008F0C333|nr:DUF2512 family protein [Paenibacillus sp. UNC496MF]SFJ32359.1 Protein of unknown function [Paenibacillus sp. UNC496MF]
MKFVLKWIVNGAIMVASLMYYAHASLWHAVVTATVITIIAYFVGDQLILRITNNPVATIADAILAYVLLWLAADSFNWSLSVGEIVIIAIVIGIAEWFIHRYVLQSDLEVRPAR